MSHVAIFTVLPNGISTTTAAGKTVFRFSALVSPRLDPAATTIVGTPFEDWPAVMTSLTSPQGAAPSSFTVWINSPQNRFAASLDPATAPASGPRFDSALWRSIFATVAVQPFPKNPYATSAVASYNAKTVSTTLKDAYRTAAVYKDPTTGAPTRPAVAYLPVGVAGDKLSTHVHGVARSLPAAHALVSGLRATPLADATGVPLPNLSSKAVKNLADPSYQEFTRAAVHYDHKNCRSTSGWVPPAGSPDQPRPPMPAPSADFHRIVGQLADHPALLRKLGLIVDFVVAVDTTITGSQSVAVLPGAWDATTFVVTVKDPGGKWTLDARHPWTQCVLGATEFRAYSQSADSLDPSRPKLLTKDGQLRVDSATGQYHLDDLDINHAAVHFANFAEHTVDTFTKQAQTSPPGPVEVALPALKSVGLALHQTDREVDVGNKFTSSYTYNRKYDIAQGNDSVITFYAEDLLRGYRVDVAVQPAGQNAPWLGLPWLSLCKRKATIQVNGAPALPPIADEGYVKASAMSTSDVNPDVPIYSLHESLFHWDGWSLVAQRPGLTIAAQSNGTGLTEQTVAPSTSGAALNLPVQITIGAQPGLPRLRFGNTYKFRVRAVDLAGSDMRHGTPATVSSTDVTTDALPFMRYEPVSPPTLVLRRPVTEGESVEVLVIRSDPYGPGNPNAAAWAANNKAAGMNPYAATCERHVAPPKTSQHLAEYHGAFDALLKTPRAAWQVAVKEEGTFFDVQVVDSSVSHLPSYTQPGRMIVTPPGTKSADGTPPQYQGTAAINRGDGLAGGQYIIFDTNEVMLPYLPDPMASGIAFQGLGGAGAQVRSFQPRVAGGSWPELGVFRLVLAEPTNGIASVDGLNDASTNAPPGALTSLTVSLPPGTIEDVIYSSTVASPGAMAFNPGNQDADVKSGKLPLLSPSRKLKLVHAVQRPAPSAFSTGNMRIDVRQPAETAITINGSLPVDGATASHVDFVARWDEFIDEGKDKVDPSTTPVKHKGTLSSHTVLYADRSVTLPANLRQLFGDTKRRDVYYSTVATTRYREYFPPSITSSSANITTTSKEVLEIIPATARPAAPKVLYVVPSFTWTTSPDGKTRTRAGGVRVYVDRTWFSSGTDERLAVILANPSLTGASTGNISHLVSAWGPDPIWMPGNKPGTLDTNHFVVPANEVPDRVIPSVMLAEAGGGAVSAVTFKPHFNMDRKLWYFDIQLNTDQSYFPFIRLALARYQPHAVNGLNLSTVVRADFVQLPADRTASVALSSGTTYNVTITGSVGSNAGTTAPTLQQAASGHYVTAEVQEARTDGVDALDWASIGPATPLLPQMSGAAVGFAGQVTVRGALATKKHRILVKEYEIFQTDDQAGVLQKREALVPGGSPVPVAYRLVYADGIPI